MVGQPAFMQKTFEKQNQKLTFDERSQFQKQQMMKQQSLVKSNIGSIKQAKTSGMITKTTTPNNPTAMVSPALK